jgi:hypothetical protein
MFSMNVLPGLSIAIALGILTAAFVLPPATGSAATPEPSSGTAAPTPVATPAPAEVAAPPGLPPVGKWMYDAAGAPAHWLGEIYRGRELREPINVLLVDGFAASVEDAKQRLVAAFARAGYPARTGHSSGYRGYIDGAFYGQLPEQKDHAFSDHHFELDNNHGRVFGPALAGGKYYFTAAFSREIVDPFTQVKHLYGSFNQARDDLAQRLDERTDYKLVGFVSLENALIGDPRLTTGDHDGIAVLLVAEKG